MRTLWLRLRAAWVTLTGTGAAVSVAFGLLVFASVLASLAIPRESVGLRDMALQRAIADSQPADRTVIGAASELSLTDSAGEVQAADIAAGGAALRARLAANRVPLASDPPAWASLTTGYLPVTGTAQTAGYGSPQLEMMYRTALASYGDVVAGRLPAGVSGTGKQVAVQAAVTTETAASFGLRVGSRLTAGPLRVVVTGIVRPANLASSFWSLQPVAVAPVLEQSQLPYLLGAVIIGPGALPLIESGLGTGETDEMEVTWVYPAALNRLTAGQAGGVEGGITSSGGATLGVPGIEIPVTVTITSQIPYILSPFIAGESAAAPVLELLYVSLAVMGAVVVLLGARLVAQRRTGEFTLMRARGAALRQLGWLVLRANLVIVAVAGTAAAALAIALTPGDTDAVSWWLAAIAIAVTLVGPVLISVVPQRVAAPVSGRAGPQRSAGRKPAARRLVIEAALLAVSIGGLVVLRNEGLSSSSGSHGLYTSAAPVLVAIIVAVLVLRCYIPIARGLARIAGLSRGVVAFVGLTRATRTPPGTVLPSFALVLVLAMVAFPDMISTSVTQGQVAASWQQVGADAIISAQPDQPIPPALVRQISSVPGVVSTTTAVTETGALPKGITLTVVLVDPATYAAVVDEAPGPRFPLAALSAGGGHGRVAGTVPAVATAAAAQLIGSAPVELSTDAGSVTIQLTGQIGGVPGVAGDTVVVLSAQAAGPRPSPAAGSGPLPAGSGPSPAAGSHPFETGLELVRGPDLDAARLSAVVSRGLPGASITFHAAALAALTTAPVPQAAQTALAQGLGAAAGFGVLVLLLSLLLTASTRQLTLASLATMGLRRWQAELLLAAETLPPVVAAAVGGVACAWLLAPLLGPSLNLAAYTGTGSAIVVTPAAFPLAASAVGLVLAALLVLAVQAVITYYRGSTRALRIAD
jgi:putative ABC transport system permease protein